MGEEEITEIFQDALTACARTESPQQLCMSTNQGKFIIIILKVKDADFMPQMRDAGTLPQVPGSDT